MVYGCLRRKNPHAAVGDSRRISGVCCPNVEISSVTVMLNPAPANVFTSRVIQVK